MNLSALLAGARAVAVSRSAKGGSLAALVSGGLYAAGLAGIAIPTWAVTAGPIAGFILYKLLPVKEEQEIDKVTDEVIDIATSIPQTYSAPSDFPNAPPEPTPSNINKG